MAALDMFRHRFDRSRLELLMIAGAQRLGLSWGVLIDA